METILLIATVAALIGAYLNSLGKWHGFAIWLATNGVFALNNYCIGQWQQALLFGCYFLTAINGMIQSRRNYGKDDQLDTKAAMESEGLAAASNNIATASTESA